jgi:hypothetical protein
MYVCVILGVFRRFVIKRLLREHVAGDQIGNRASERPATNRSLLPSYSRSTPSRTKTNWSDLSRAAWLMSKRVACVDLTKLRHDSAMGFEVLIAGSCDVCLRGRVWAVG